MATTSALLTNNASSTLASGITNVATSMTLATGEGARFPNPGASEYFYATLSNAAGSSIEIVKCTARSTDTLTIVRGQDDTTGLAFSTGDIVELRPIAALFREKLDIILAAKSEQNAQTGTSYGPVASDRGKMVTLSNAAAITVTISSATHEATDRIDFTQKGAGQVTFVGSGVTINSRGGKLKLFGQYAGCTIWFESSTVAYIYGDLTT